MFISTTVPAASPSFQQLFESHSAVMLLLDPVSGRIEDANQAASRFYGYTRQQLRSMRIQQINTLTPEEVAEERALAAQQDREFFVFRHRLANNDIRTVKVASVPFAFDQRQLLFSIVTDISSSRQSQGILWHYQSRLEETIDRQAVELLKGDRLIIVLLAIGTLILLITIALLLRALQRGRQTEQLLSMEQTRLEEIIRGTNVGTWEWNIQTGEAHFNERWAEIAGYTLDELQPISIESWSKLVHPEDLKKSAELFKKNFRGELNAYECEFRMLHKQGHWVWVIGRGKVVEWTLEGKPLRMSGTQQDISRRKAADAHIQYLARHDTLTGLPNRVQFLDHCVLALTAARRDQNLAALLFLDLNKFKPVNDNLGHDAGDQVLQLVAGRLKNCVREADMVARFGGDEFVVLLGSIDSRAPVRRVTEQIIGALRAPYRLSDGREAIISCSVGIACYPEDGKSVENLISSADAAMYRAKRSGSGFSWSSESAQGDESPAPRLCDTESRASG